MVSRTASWKTGNLDPQAILLDVKNPRIEVKQDAAQDEIRLKLLEFEDVLELARDIEKSNGLFYGERIITVIENGHQVVLEGNRRVAACQMLLRPGWVPSSFKARFPKVSPATRDALTSLPADIAPNREIAEPILTKRHTERGIKPWSPVAKMRRAVRLLDTMSVEEVARLLGTTPSQVKKLIRPYRLLKYALNLKGWTAGERLALEDEKLKTNPYTRFFTLSGTKGALQAHFDNDDNIVSALPTRVFSGQMKRIVRDFLIPDPVTGRPRCDTRTEPEQYFSAFVNSPEGQSVAVVASPVATPARAPTHIDSPVAPQAFGKGAGSGIANRPTTPKASVFFEHLVCHIQDDRLLKLTGELSKINHERMPIAASLLTRALFECVLVYKLQKMKRWGELIKVEKRDPGLAAIIKFCGNISNGIFIEPNMCKTLQSHTTIQSKNYLDAIAHLKYQEADPRMLESVANNLRQIMQHILNGQ